MGERKRALISVSDKTGLADFAKGLEKEGFEIISTGGTFKALKEAGVKVKEVSDVTGFPEMLDGRVKTLHPFIHAGILALRSSKEHMQKLKEHKIVPIDLVCVNLYPFRETISKKDVSIEHAIENIDIGGPTMIRAAAKNYQDVAVVVNPAQYGKILQELNEKKSISLETKMLLAKEAFEHTAFYDSMVSGFLREKFSCEKYPKQLSLGFEKMQDCRYGENPHQSSAVYREPIVEEPCISNAKQLQGKELSFNNFNDANGAIELCKEFEGTAVVIAKHANPCGVSTAKTVSEAFKEALECDPGSAFGGIIVLNRECDLATAEQITAFFNEIVVAPSYDRDSLEEFAKKPNLRVLQIEGLGKGFEAKGMDLKKIVGGLLVQDRDLKNVSEKDLKVISEKKPSKEQIASLLFAWRVCKHVKSNSVVLAQGTKTVGIGAGQMSRIDSLEIAVKKSSGKAKGAVLASEAFFPFRDTIDAAVKAGISAIIETGGSVRDPEVIKASNEHGIPLVFTGVRHFKH
ncbi:MAG: bifunctional phosphoribosylaminoimidazolecarboxamide formyltransferase/IMP cyclohydrolase [Candidatus Diapherotrites archaeon]